MTPSNQNDLRQVYGKFLTGITVVTALDEQQGPIGFTANSFTSVSLEPPLVLVCLAYSAGLAPAFQETGSFAVNILGAEQEQVSNQFAGRDIDRFEGIAWEKRETGSPVLDDCIAWLDCELVEKVDAGDHFIMIGRVLSGDKSDREALAYYQGRYCTLDLTEQE